MGIKVIHSSNLLFERVCVLCVALCIWVEVIGQFVGVTSSPPTTCVTGSNQVARLEALAAPAPLFKRS